MFIYILEPVVKVLENETKEIKKDVHDILDKLERNLDVGFPHIRSLSSIHKRLFEIRLKDRNGPFRLIYFIKKRQGIYLSHAFRKKTQKMAEKERKIIFSRLKEVKDD